jgi:PAS domain S-box-containing protein
MENPTPLARPTPSPERQILDASPIGTLITRISDGTILFANHAIGKMLGLGDVEGVIGTPVPNFYGDPHERQVVLDRFRAEGKLEGYELHARRLDGSLFWVEISIQPFEFEGEKVILSTVLDITARKEAEQRLQESEQRLQVIFNALPQPVIVTRISDGLVLYANQQLSDLFGIPLDQLLGMQTPDFYANPADRLRFVQTLQKEGRLRGAEIQLKRQDGSLFWAEITIELTSYQGATATVAIIEDITARRQVQAEIVEQRERLQSIAANVPGVVYQFYALPSGEFGLNYVSDRAADVFELQGNFETFFPEFVAHIHPEDRPGFIASIQQAAASVSPWHYEGRFVKNSGAVLWFSGASTPTLLPDRVVFNGLLLDISEQRQAQEALRANEERLELALSAANIANWEFEPLAGRVYFSPRWFTMLGYEPDELPQAYETWAGLLHPDERTWVEAQIGQEIQAGGNFELTFRMKTRDGNWRWINAIGRTTDRNEAGVSTRMVGTHLDITERKQAEDQLRKSEANLASALHVANMGYWEFDIASQMFTFNDQYYSLHGTTAQAVGGYQMSAQRFAQEFVYPEDAATVGMTIQQAIESADPNFQIQVEARILHKDGQPRWVSVWFRIEKDEQGRIIKLYGVNQDIHERKQAEQTVRESEQRFRGMAGAMVDGLAIIEGREVVYINDRLCEMTGYSREELSRKSSTDYAAPEEKERLAQAAAHARQSGAPLTELSFWIVRKDGQRRYLHNRYAVLSGPENQVVGRVIITTDETERVLLEQQVRQSLERRGYQVQLSTEISQEIAAASDLTILFERVVTLVRERLNYYHTQLLRYDPTQDAVVLIAGYGETGAKMLSLNHRMPLGRGLIGLAAQTGQTVLRPDLAAGDPNWQPNPLLPETKGEIAVPIKLGQQILGVLDVQSSQAGALGEDDRLLLEGLCGQIAIAIEQTRLRQEMTERLEEINTLYRSMNRQGWADFLQTAELPRGFLFDQAGTHPLTADVAVSAETFAAAPLAIPGGGSIGSLALADDPERPLTPEDHAFLQQISEQVALALESARLFSQTQSTLAMTETLYAGSERIIRAGTMNDTLAAVMETTALARFDRASIMIFNRPWAAQSPETGTVAAQWTQPGSTAIVPMGAVFPIGHLPFAAFMRRDAPVFISDIESDERIDPQTRAMISNIGKSMAFFPLVTGDQWYGFLITASSEPVNLTPAALRQVESLVGQAATVIQSIRLYEQAQAAAQRERILREVTTQVRASVDADTILRTAVRELGQALGRETFVRIGGQPQ